MERGMEERGKGRNMESDTKLKAICEVTWRQAIVEASQSIHILKEI